MKEGNIQLLDLDFEYKIWKNKLQYFRAEIKILEDRVYVLSREFPGFDISKDNKDIITNQQEFIQRVLNKIKTREQEMAHFAEDYPICEDHSHFKLHEKVREEIEIIRNLQQELINGIYTPLCYPIGLEKS